MAVTGPVETVPTDSALDHAYEVLRRRRYSASKIWRIESAGDSGMGCEVILFTNAAGQAKTLLMKGSALTVVKGWGVI